MNTTPSPPSFTLSIVDVGGAVLLRAAGDLDIATAPQLDRELEPLHARICELDLAGVPFTDSTGVNLLTRHHRQAVRAGGSLQVVAVSRPVRCVLDITGTSGMLLACDDPPPWADGGSPG
ncbi:STAS domain-containing protein [Streptomyces sp. TRM66268-LWL]|uniref:Anti-sigma factor antagonist n=1 Tax=Streptomyces polyasparticus TaxID=2767826 RepID=A0ABR7SWC3_9ACTN|nr:STAS domain-containing protein [Streptomyces polyasparticus]MBC9719079.1 STAS domain-containing protein [Streptomyces polyasparticus]